MNDISIEQRQEIRKRMYEQSIHLNNRTNNFLLVNSILIAGSQLNKNTIISISIIVVGFILAIFWFLTSFQSKAIIKNLAIAYHQNDDDIDRLIEEKKLPIGFRPTDILAIWLPLIFLLLWIVLFLIYSDYLNDLIYFLFNFLRLGNKC